MTETTVVDAARRLAPELSERALENEQRRTMAPDLIDKMRAAGLFHLGLPAELGGLECDPLTILETIEELSRADGAAGWTASIGNGTTFFAWLEPEVAKEIVSHRTDFTTAGAFAPTGTARPDGADLVIDGRWSFVSGCSHADWLFTGVIVTDGDQPRQLPSGRPDYRFAVYPANEATIHDTWHVAGLRGTGSHDVSTQGVRVPAERTMMPFFEQARFDGPLYRLPFPTLIMSLFAGVPLGIARRALDEFAALGGEEGARRVRRADDGRGPRRPGRAGPRRSGRASRPLVRGGVDWRGLGHGAGGRRARAFVAGERDPGDGQCCPLRPSRCRRRVRHGRRRCALRRQPIAALRPRPDGCDPAPGVESGPMEGRRPGALRTRPRGPDDLGAGLRQALARPSGELGSVGQAELGEHVADMAFDRAH